MKTPYQRIKYEKRNGRARENYNYHKVSAVLAEYGFNTLRLSDDWQGADFIAQHVSGEYLKVQLKSRLGFAKKYNNRDVYICFRNGKDVYLFPHDELLKQAKKLVGHHKTKSWIDRGEYNWGTAPKKLLQVLEPYKLTAADP
jgi:hypothetical protein